MSMQSKNIKLVALATIVLGSYLTFSTNIFAYSYRQDRGKYLYFTDSRIRCGEANDGLDSHVIDELGNELDFCQRGDSCQTVGRPDGKSETGCYVFVLDEPAPVESVPPKPQVTLPKPPTASCDSDWNVVCCDGKSDSLFCPPGSFSSLDQWKSEACSDHGGYGSCPDASDTLPSSSPSVVVNPPSENPTSETSDSIVTVKYKVANNQISLQSAQWQTYTQGGVTVSVPSQIYSVDPSVAKQAIFVQFLDNHDQIIKFSNGSDFDVQYIELKRGASTQAIAGIEAMPTVIGSNKIWETNLVKVNISGFAETNKTLVEVYFRNQAGICSISTCGFNGWTKIKSYGTNGFDQFNWTPKPGDVEAGVHMFGVFAVNRDGVADKILSIFPTNYVPR